MNKLTTLILSKNKIKKVENLEPLISLKKLQLGKNPIDEIAPNHFEFIMKETNSHTRKNLISMIGQEELLKKLPVQLLDERKGYELVLIQLALEDYTGNIVCQDSPYLKMKNPSTGEWHIEGVHPECRTVSEALAWRDGELVYQEPEVLT